MMKNTETLPRGRECTKCGEFKSLDEFHKQKGRKFGRRPHCKECVKKYLQTDKGKDVHRKAVKKYEQSDKGKENRKKYRQSEKGKENRREYAQSDKGKEAKKKGDKKYQQSDKGKEAQKKRRQSEKRKEYMKEYLKEYAQSDKGKEAKKKAAKKYHQSETFRITTQKRNERYKDSGYLEKRNQNLRVYIKELFDRDGDDCYLCGNVIFNPFSGTECHVDHVVDLIACYKEPWANDPSNLKLTHAECNLRKERHEVAS